METPTRFSYLAAVVLMIAGTIGRADEPLWGERLRLARFDLELRRAGGPDPELVVRLLADADASSGVWLPRAARACAAGAFSCAAILPALREARGGDVAPLSADLAVFRTAELLGELEHLEGQDRVRALEDLLERQLATVDEAPDKIAWRQAHERALEVAGFALQEGHLDLLPLIQGSWLGRYSGVRDCEVYAAALHGADPIAALLQIVVDAAAADARVAPEPRTQRPPFSALLAVGELRRLNPLGVLTDLRDILASYPCQFDSTADHLEPRGPGVEVSFSELDPRWARGAERRRRDQIRCLGDLGVAVAELVGDLGDRETESRLLAGEPLWLQVERGEQREAELLARDEREKSSCAEGLLLPGEVIASLDALLGIRLAIEAYGIDHGTYPDARGLDQLAPLLEPYQSAGGRAPEQWVDGWGHTLEAEVAGMTYQIRSLGRDGVRDQTEPLGAVNDLDRDLILGDRGLLQWPVALPPQTVELRQRFTYCMFRLLEPGMSEAQAVALLGSQPGEGADAAGGRGSLRWSNGDGSAIVVHTVGGCVASFDWQVRQRPW